MSINQRVQFSLKCFAFAIMLGAALTGHPPSRAQEPTTAEDARQDSDIRHNVQAITDQTTRFNSMDLVVVQQGQDIARLDTKITILFGILAAIQGGGIVVNVVGKQKAKA